MITPETIGYIRNNIITFAIFVVVYLLYRKYMIEEVYYAMSILQPFAAQFNSLSERERAIIARIKYDYPDWDVKELITTT